MITELVVIDGYYAIRKTERKYFVFTEITFLDLTSNESIIWRPRDSVMFNCCLTLDITVAKKKLAICGSNIGVPFTGDIVSVTEMMSMINLAQTNEGMKDLLLKAKEFYILSK